jgi:hypothetical protein
MGLFDSLRKALRGPAHVQGGGDEGASAALHEEYGASDAAGQDVKRMETTAGGAVTPGIGGSEAAEAADADLGEESQPGS